MQVEITPQVLGTQSATDFEVLYFSSMADANANLAGTTLPNPYTNTTANTTETIYARIQNKKNMDCATITNFTIAVRDVPVANQPNNINSCDADRDGFFAFDLQAEITPQILGIQSATDFEVLYFSSMVDANANLAGTTLPNPYTNATAYTTETIYTRIQNKNKTDCATITNFMISPRAVPIANQPNNFNSCDADRDGFFAFDLQAEITPQVLGTQSATDFEILYFSSMADANANLAGTTLPNPYTNTTANTTETIYARIQNKKNMDCATITNFTIAVRDVPVAENPKEYRLCDTTSVGSDTDGFINNFILSSKDSEILGLSNSSLQFNVSYHTSLVGAQTDNTTDVIDKTTNYTNIIANTQQIFVRVENKENTTCFDASKSFNLVVSRLPTINSVVELKQCDNDTDGFSDFNLNQVVTAISTDFLNQTFTFFPTLADANANTNVYSPAEALTFTNRTVNSDKVWARATNSFGCYRISEVILTISTTGIPTNFQKTFIQCDDFLDLNGNDSAANSDTDGISSFNFSSVTPEVIALFPVGQQLTVTYYRNEADALAEINAITDTTNYRNIGYPNAQTLYIRVDSNLDNDCLGFGTHITLYVDPTPTANPVIDLEKCDDFDDGNGTNGVIQSFNLEQQTATILGNQNPANYTVTYHLTAAEAAAGNNPLLSPFTNTTRDSQPIFVRVTNNTKDCFTSQTSFNVIVNPLPVAYPTLDIEVCDDDSDGSARDGFSQIINLESRTATILGSQDPALFSVSYHASLTDAQNDSNPLLSPFSNTVANRQRIYVRVFNQTTQCANGISNFDVIIHPKPLANPDNTLSNLSLCDTNIDGDDTNGFVDDIDFSIQIPTILGTSQDPDDFNISFHANQADATSGNNPLSTKAYSNSARQETIFVRIKNIATGCVNDNLTFLLIIKELPRFSVTGNTPENPQILCLNYTTPHTLVVENPAGMYQYQWTDKTGTVLGTDASLIITAAGEYTIKATDNTTTCSRQRTIYVKESEVATLNEGVVTIIDETNNIGSQNTISIAINTENLGKGDYQFAIINTDTNTRIPIIGFQDAPLFENLEGGIYTIIVNDKNGCVQDTILTISVIQFPKFFTPNGDGRNDTWAIKGANKTFYPNSSINIFNRYGELVAQIPLDSKGWNGVYNGKNLPSDDYWYSVQLTPANSEKERISKKGHFSLLRE